jgi:lysyl-tRNA synthetase class II
MEQKQEDQPTEPQGEKKQYEVIQKTAEQRKAEKEEKKRLQAE